MNKLLILIFCILGACTSISNNSSKTYYIDAELGNDSRSGNSEAEAWKSLKNINLNDFGKGAHIFLKRGQVFHGTLELDRNDSGSESNPIVISCYGNESYRLPEIKSDKSHAIQADSIANLIIKGIKITGAGRKKGNITSGLIVKNGKNIQLDSLDVSGYQKCGIKVFSSKNVKITRTYAHLNGMTGIMVAGDHDMGYSKNIYLGYCTTNNNPGDPTAFDNHSGSGIIIRQTDAALIEYCTASNNGWDMPRKGNGPVGIWAHDANNITIQYCIAYNNESTRGAADGGGFDLDGGITNSLVQYNYSYDNNGSGYGLFQYAGTSIWENNIIRYNISYNDGEGNENTGIYIWSAEPKKDLLRNCRIYNNVVVNELGSAIKYSGAHTNYATDPNGFKFYNNIFISKDEPVEGEGSNSVFSNNLWYRIDNKRISKKHDNSGIYNVEPGIVMPEPHNYRMTDPTQLKSFELFKLHEGSPAVLQGKELGIRLN